jgi:hypothetical protein
VIDVEPGGERSGGESESPINGGARVEIGGDLARQRAEALQLEIRRLAKRYGVEVRRLAVEKVTTE